MGDEEGLEPPPTTIRNRYHLVVAVLPLHQSSLCLLYSANMIKVIHIGFSELFLLTRLNIFTSACIDDSSFRCSPSAYLIRLAGFPYVVRPFTGSRRPTVLSGYFFSTHTISVHQYVKELFFNPICQTLI